MRDRVRPAWLKTLSFLFALGGEACLLSLAVMTIFYHSLVAEGGETLLAFLITLLATAPLLGFFVFEVGYSKALAGYRQMRNRAAIASRAVVAVLVCGVMACLHPLLAVPVALGAVLSWTTVWGGSRALREPAWDFLPQEAVSVLSGRDRAGLQMAFRTAGNHVLVHAGQSASSWLAMIMGFACASWLAANGVFNAAAIAAAGVLSFWSVDRLGRYFLSRSRIPPEQSKLAHSVAQTPAGDSQADEAGEGLWVRDLSAAQPGGRVLLNSISLDLPPGSVVSVTGGNFAGKSMFMQALADPFALQGLDVRGAVAVGGLNPWNRTGRGQRPIGVHLPADPLLMPGSGLQNLSCFGSPSEQERAAEVLRKFVFTSDTVAHICAAPDANLLSASEKKALGFARAFFLRPQLYLIDRPEDSASEDLIGALARRIERERKMGSVILLCTGDRRLLELCDQMIVLEGGRLVDHGPAAEIRKRHAAGWTRFSAARSLASEEALNSWLRAQFRRNGDEVNRRNVCGVANELLAFSCQDRGGAMSQQELRFEFRNFEGHCLLRLVDQGQPLSTGQIERAQEEAANAADLQRVSPLAAVFRDSAELTANVDAGRRVIEAKISTTDPRKRSGKQGSRHDLRRS